MTGDARDRPDASHTPTRVPAWWVFRDSGEHRAATQTSPPLPRLPLAPPWRRFGSGDGSAAAPVIDPADIIDPAESPDVGRRLGSRRGGTLAPEVLNLINSAIHLRRPLLVSGRPGTGKSSLAHQIASELGLGRVLWWPVVSRTTLRDGLYDYDAIGRIQNAPPPFAAPAGPPAAGDGHNGSAASSQSGGPPTDVGRYLTLGPLGTALLPWRRPRVLLIDELDKSDIDLPNDLLHIFEEGEFRIRELERLRRDGHGERIATDDHGALATVHNGHVRCGEFPIVVITSNGEREFPPAFRRRCLHVEMPDPDRGRLAAMLTAHFDRPLDRQSTALLTDFLDRRREGRQITADQLLNTMHMLTNGAADAGEESWRELCDALWRSLAPDASP